MTKEEALRLCVAALESAIHSTMSLTDTKLLFHGALAAAREALAEQPAAPAVLTDADLFNIASDAVATPLRQYQPDDFIKAVRAILAAAVPPGCVVVPSDPPEEMVDAPRQILLYADTTGRTFEGCREFLRCAGVDYKAWAPDWFLTQTGHLTKAGLAILVYHAMLAARPGAPK